MSTKAGELHDRGLLAAAPHHPIQEKQPKIEISLVISNTAGVSKAVKSGEADLGFVEGHVEDPLLVKIDLGSDQLVLVIGYEAPGAR